MPCARRPTPLRTTVHRAVRRAAGWPRALRRLRRWLGNFAGHARRTGARSRDCRWRQRDGPLQELDQRRSVAALSIHFRHTRTGPASLSHTLSVMLLEFVVLPGGKPSHFTRTHRRTLPETCAVVAAWMTRIPCAFRIILLSEMRRAGMRPIPDTFAASAAKSRRGQCSQEQQDLERRAGLEGRQPPPGNCLAEQVGGLVAQGEALDVFA